MAAIANVDADALRLYSDHKARALCSAIAEVEGVAVDNVFVGNGSDEVLGHTFQALLGASPVVNVLDITYNFYPAWAKLYGLKLRELPLTEDFRIDVQALCANEGPILIANPNAPTGIALGLNALKTLVHSNPKRLVVVDEAYFGFGSDSAVSLLPDADNLLIIRTFSKSHALAGLRVGYALGASGLIDGLVRVKDSFNSYPLDALAQAGAVAAIQDKVWLQKASEEVVRNREQLFMGLESLGFEVLPSETNFVFARHPAHSGKVLFEGLHAANILVRRWDKPSRISEYLRITVGTVRECEVLLARLRELLDIA